MASVNWELFSAPIAYVSEWLVKACAYTIERARWGYTTGSDRYVSNPRVRTERSAGRHSRELAPPNIGAPWPACTSLSDIAQNSI